VRGCDVVASSVLAFSCKVVFTSSVLAFLCKVAFTSVIDEVVIVVIVVVVVVSISSKLMSTLDEPSGSSWSRPGFCEAGTA